MGIVRRLSVRTAESSSKLPRQSRKKRVPWMAYLWPGLPHLWVKGSWAGLALAIGFTLLLNLAILNLLVWPELMEPRAKWVGGVALLLLWLAALWETRGELHRQAESRRAAREGRIDPETERGIFFQFRLKGLGGADTGVRSILRDSIFHWEDYDKRDDF